MAATEKKFVPIGIKGIKEILPHRYPFLLVDRIVEFDPDKKTLIARKCVSGNEEFFQGHFPEGPVMPGVLIIEAMAQAGGVLTSLMGFDKDIALLLSVKEAKFRRRVVPGDLLELHMEAELLSSRGGRVKGKAYVDGQVVAEAISGYAFAKKEDL